MTLTYALRAALVGFACHPLTRGSEVERAWESVRRRRQSPRGDTRRVCVYFGGGAVAHEIPRAGLARRVEGPLSPGERAALERALERLGPRGLPRELGVGRSESSASGRYRVSGATGDSLHVTTGAVHPDLRPRLASLDLALDALEARLLDGSPARWVALGGTLELGPDGLGMHGVRGYVELRGDVPLWWTLLVGRTVRLEGALRCGPAPWVGRLTPHTPRLELRVPRPAVLRSSGRAPARVPAGSWLELTRVEPSGAAWVATPRGLSSLDLGPTPPPRWP